MRISITLNLERLKMNKINDRDISELNSFWVYQDLKISKDIDVNGKNSDKLMNLKIILIVILKVLPMLKLLNY